MDYLTGPEANLAACSAAEQFAANLDEDPSYAGLAVVPSGLRVYIVEPPSPAVSLALANLRTLVPVEIQAVRTSLRELMNVAAKLHDDHEAWAGKGIALSGWGPSVGVNRVKVYLQRYEPQFAQALIDEYGADVLTVSTTPKTFTTTR